MKLSVSKYIYYKDTLEATQILHIVLQSRREIRNSQFYMK